jgi:carbonic anhydrase
MGDMPLTMIKTLAIAWLLLLSAPTFASLCESGRRQSPIDIHTTQRKALPPLQFDYPAVPLTLANDGETVRVRLQRSGQMHIGNSSYLLQQFHFHTPGGDRIAGEEFPLAAHVLHKSPQGQLLAIVVLFRLGAANPVVDKLLPLIPQRADGDHAIRNATISAADLLPASKGYYRYTGSLTSLPCTEGVEWVVMKQPVELSAAQLARYKQLFSNNGRAPQPVNQRVILESQ